MDEREKVLLCHFADGRIETFDADSIIHWQGHKDKKIWPPITHFRYLPDPPKDK